MPNHLSELTSHYCPFQPSVPAMLPFSLFPLPRISFLQVHSLCSQFLEVLLKSHPLKWDTLWQHFVKITTPPPALTALSHLIFHHSTCHHLEHSIFYFFHLLSLPVEIKCKLHEQKDSVALFTGQSPASTMSGT